MHAEYVAQAVERLGALRYFPTNDAAQTEIASLLLRMATNEMEVEWLISAMIDQVGEWHGTKELRAVFCTRFKPKDGIEVDSAIPGFRPIDSEALMLTAHEQLKQLEQAPPTRKDIEATHGLGHAIAYAAESKKLPELPSSENMQ